VTVALRFQAAPEHVRTARLVAVAVARRAGMDEVRLDEIRLAVGEMCARAVRRSLQSGGQNGVRGDVLVELDDQGPTLDVTVTDTSDVGDVEEESVSLPLVRGLADAVSVESGPGGPGGVVRMIWAR
jgi:anti-sigma regulatory factor (Ser/Thr protein kinase)